MEIVNKWISVIIFALMIIPVTCILISGSGRYQMQVVELGQVDLRGPDEGYHVVYVLDTKEGGVSARMVRPEEDLVNTATRKPYKYLTQIVKKAPRYRGY